MADILCLGAIYNTLKANASYTATPVNNLKTFYSAYLTLNKPCPKADLSLDMMNINITSEDYQNIHDATVSFILYFTNCKLFIIIARITCLSKTHLQLCPTNKLARLPEFSSLSACKTLFTCKLRKASTSKTTSLKWARICCSRLNLLNCLLWWRYVFTVCLWIFLMFFESQNIVIDEVYNGSITNINAMKSCCNVYGGALVLANKDASKVAEWVQVFLYNCAHFPSN